MAPAADRDFEVVLARQFYRVHNVGNATAARNQRRPLVDQTVMDLSRVIVAGIGRLQELPCEGLAKFADRVAQSRC